MDVIGNDKVCKEEIIKAIDEMLSKLEQMPPHAMLLPLTQYDYQSLLLLLKAFCASAN